MSLYGITCIMTGSRMEIVFGPQQSSESSKQLISTPEAVESPGKVLCRRVAQSRIDTGVGTREDVTAGRHQGL